jgi:hypothetical protein
MVQPCDPTDAGTWAVVGGTGRYSGLRGAGTLVGDYYPTDVCDAVGVVDHLSGSYLLRAEPEQVDSRHFARLVGDGQQLLRTGR